MASFHLALSSLIVLKGLFLKCISKSINVSWACDKQPASAQRVVLQHPSAVVPGASCTHITKCSISDAQMQLLRQTCCSSYKSPRIGEGGGLLRDLSHSLSMSVCSGASNAAERRNVPWQLPTLPRRYWACSGHLLGERPMLFQLVLQASLGWGIKAAFSLMKEVFSGNRLPDEMCSFAFLFPFPKGKHSLMPSCCFKVIYTTPNLPPHPKHTQCSHRVMLHMPNTMKYYFINSFPLTFSIRAEHSCLC